VKRVKESNRFALVVGWGQKIQIEARKGEKTKLGVRQNNEEMVGEWGRANEGTNIPRSSTSKEEGENTYEGKHFKETKAGKPSMGVLEENQERQETLAGSSIIVREGDYVPITQNHSRLYEIAKIVAVHELANIYS